MKNIKKILAIFMVIFLLALYVWAFVAALFARPEAGGVFNAAIFASVFFPVLLYIYMWTAKWLKGRGVDKNNIETKNENEIKNKK
jgi:hypothetical protein